VKDELLSWYGANGRSLPWRETNDPYAILVSEVMLQQKPVTEGQVPEVQEESRFLA
jgi:A/G-specific adenine glycosylase